MSLKKDSTGMVTFVYNIKKTSNIANNDVICRLPVGYRPFGPTPKPATSYSGAWGTTTVYVNAAGDVTCLLGGSFTALFGDFTFQAVN
jgi:hypothetical protein